MNIKQPFHSFAAGRARDLTISGSFHRHSQTSAAVRSLGKQTQETLIKEVLCRLKIEETTSF